MKTILFFILSIALFSASAQRAVGFTSIGANGGGSINAPCTEILQFDNYDDNTAGGVNGQDFVFILQSGDSLFFNLQRTNAPIAAVSAPSFVGAAFGQYGYTGMTGLPVLYQTEGASNSNLNFTNIHVKKNTGAARTDYVLVVLDGESTNVVETFVTTVAPQSNIFFWDSIVPPMLDYGTPPQTGIGTNQVTWGPGLVSYDYQTAFAVATDSPSTLSVAFTHTASGLEGMCMGVLRRIIATNDTICSGNQATIQILNAAPGSTYTWSAPVIDPPGSITGATAQSSPVTNIQQTLVNNTSGIATATYSIIPNSCGAAGQAVTATILISPGTLSTSHLSFCGDTTATLIAAGPGTWVAASTNPGPTTILNPNSDSTTVHGITGTGSYRFIHSNPGGCTDTVQVFGSINDSVHISSNKKIFCSNDSAQICATPGFSSYQWNIGETGSCIYVTSAGNYYVTATDANGCTAESNHVPESVYPVPSVSIIVLGDTLTSYGAVTYHWYYDGTPIDGATSTVYIAHQPGDYSLAVTDTNGCLTVSNPVDVTGINEIGVEHLSIYPNPSTGTWTLKTDASMTGSVAEIYDEAGRMIGTFKISSTTNEIATNISSAGIYWLKITSSNFNITRKLIKW